MAKYGPGRFIPGSNNILFVYFPIYIKPGLIYFLFLYCLNRLNTLIYDRLIHNMFFSKCGLNSINFSIILSELFNGANTLNQYSENERMEIRTPNCT